MLRDPREYQITYYCGSPENPEQTTHCKKRITRVAIAVLAMPIIAKSLVTELVKGTQVHAFPLSTARRR